MEDAQESAASRYGWTSSGNGKCVRLYSSLPRNVSWSRYNRFADPTELAVEVLRYGLEVDVIAPESLMRDIENRVSQMRGIHW